MTKQEILATIARYEQLIATPNVPQDEKDFAAEEITDLKAQLASLDTKDDPKPQPAAKRGRPATNPPKVKTRKDPAKYAPGDTIGNMVVMDEVGNYLDTNGDVLAIGDVVEVETSAGVLVGTVSSFARFKGGGHSITVTSGRKRGMMAPPNKVTKIDAAEVSTDKKMPTNLIKSAKVVNRADCDENQVVLVTPTELTVVASPQIADPANGDKIMVNKQGHPITVVAGDTKDYTEEGTAVITAKDGKVESVGNKETKEEDEKKKDKEEKKDDQLKPIKPPKDCDFLKGKEEPVLHTFLEGMRAMFREGKTSDKVERVTLRKSDKKIILQVKRFFFLDMVPGIFFYSVCLNTGKLTPVKKQPTRDEAQTIMGLDAMKDFYREPNSNACRRISKELHVTCYREGNCSEERKKELLKEFVGTCRKREDELTRSYRKYVHQKTREKYDLYTGEKSYAQIYKEVVQGLK